MTRPTRRTKYLWFFSLECLSPPAERLMLFDFKTTKNQKHFSKPLTFDVRLQLRNRSKAYWFWKRALWALVYVSVRSHGFCSPDKTFCERDAWSFRYKPLPLELHHRFGNYSRCDRGRCFGYQKTRHVYSFHSIRRLNFLELNIRTCIRRVITFYYNPCYVIYVFKKNLFFLPVSFPVSRFLTSQFTFNCIAPVK